MAGGTGETGLAGAFEFHVVLLGYFEDVLALLGHDLTLGSVALDEGELDLLGEEGFAGVGEGC